MLIIFGNDFGMTERWEKTGSRQNDKYELVALGCLSLRSEHLIANSFLEEQNKRAQQFRFDQAFRPPDMFPDWLSSDRIFRSTDFLHVYSCKSV